MIVENETVLIIDYGSQYTQLIARKIREQNVYCLVHPYNKIKSKHTFVIIETSKEEEISIPEGLTFFKEKVYGKTKILFLN